MVLIPGDQMDKLHHVTMWRANFDHFANAVGFTTCSEIQAKAETYRHSNGGDMIGEEYIGGFSYDDITLERGFDQDMELQNWWDAVCNALQQTSVLPSSYKHDGEIILLNADGSEGPKWELHRAFPKQFKAIGGMDANNKAAAIMTNVVLGVRHWKYAGM